MRSRVRTGSVVQDKRDKVWRFYWWENGKRRARAFGQFASKTAAIQAADKVRDELRKARTTQDAPTAPTVAQLIEGYRAEKMPKRYSTRRSYDVWLRLYVQPRWGDSPITELQARPVELWLLSSLSRPAAADDPFLNRAAVGLRNVARRCSHGSQSHEPCHDSRCIQAHAEASQSHCRGIPQAA